MRKIMIGSGIALGIGYYNLEWNNQKITNNILESLRKLEINKTMENGLRICFLK